MSKIAIATDSNSGLTQKAAEELGVFVLPMPIFINSVLYTEGLSISHEEFFRLQNEGAQITSSQPSPQDVLDFWDRILENYDTVIYLPMSSGLSSSCATAMALSQDYDGRVRVVDNVRISVPLKRSVIEAKEMADTGASADEICDFLLATKEENIVYITVSSLEHLKQGGRITPAVASIGTLLNIKPVIVIDGAAGGRLDLYGQCRGVKAAKKKIIQTLKADISRRFHCQDISELNLLAAGCLTPEDSLAWKQELETAFGAPCSMDPLPLSVGTHTGFGVWGAGLTRKYHIG